MGFYKELYTLRVILELENKWWIKLIRSKPISEIVSSFKKVTFKSQVEEEYLVSQTNVVLKIINTAKEISPEAIPNNTFSALLPLFNNLFLAIESNGPKSVDA